MDQPEMLLSPAGVDQLRAALTGAGYTSNGIAARLGVQATGGVARNDYRAAL
ncbi:methyltransferase, partial [Micromonospora zhanjiangensis]